jgi:hypothetical protein
MNRLERLFKTISYGKSTHPSTIFTRAKRLLAMAFVVACSFPAAYAQEQAPQTPTGQRNLVKINLSSLVVRNFSFQYERIVGSKTSVALGLRIMPAGGLPFSSRIEQEITDEGADNKEVAKFLENTSTAGIALTPEFRYYFGARSGKGLYLAPFVRYEQMHLKSNYRFVDEEDVSTNILFTGKYQTFGIGIMLGAQFQLSRHFALDWWIAGPYYTAPRIHLHASGYQLSNDELALLRDNLEGIEIDFSNFKTESSVNAQRATLSAKGSLAAIRAFGICLAYRF